MSQEFKRCLERGKITKFTPGVRLAKKELRLAGEDLATALKSSAEGNCKWSIVQAYYSMFHSARALLYAKNYREQSHYCLIEAVRCLYVEEKVLDAALIESLVEAKNLREAADYYGDFSEINCMKLIKRAEEFLSAAKKILNKKRKSTAQRRNFKRCFFM
jgi:uncharacterized protein (UPF0332 family)